MSKLPVVSGLECIKALEKEESILVIKINNAKC